MKAAHVAAFLITGLMTTGLRGQVVTPPPKSPEPQPAPSEPPPPPPQTGPIQIQPTRAASKRPKMNELPDLPYQSLVRYNDRGEVIPLEELPELAALRVNPTLPDNYPEHIRDYLADRVVTFERIVVANLDLLELVERGFIESADYGTKEGITHVVQTLRPLDVPNTPKRLTDDLEEKGMIDPTQAQFNMKILGEYYKAVYSTAKPPEGTDPDSPRAKNLVAKTMRRFAVAESEIRYKAMLSEAVEKLATLLGGVDLPEDVRAKAREVASRFRPEMTMPQRIALWHEATGGMTLEQRKAILQHMLDTRGK
jgi:hypothetical protein